jgi:putative endonuclease
LSLTFYIQKKKDSYYVGSTSNIEDRLKRHNRGASNYTKRGIPWKLVFIKEFISKDEAYQFEMYIKKQKSKKYIQEIVQSQKV